MIHCDLDKTPYGRRDFYLGNDAVRRSGSQPTRWTQALQDEYRRCKEDVNYFASKYVKILTLDEGLVTMQPFDYQKKMWNLFNDNRFSVVLACRQSGKTVGVVAYLLWFTIFNPGKFVAVVAHEAGQAREILDRYARALENLPFFLQPGCKTLNKGKIVFDIDTTIQSFSATAGSLRGKSVNLLYLDEFAFVEHDAKFMTATYPIITAGKTSRVIVTSTPNGIGNQFHKIYSGAVEGVNEYKHMTVNWWDVPGRDEEWKRETIANTSEEQFRQEFGVEFLGSSATLINPNALLSMQIKAPIWKNDEGLRIYEQPFKADPNIPASRNGVYVMTVDVCKGRGKDYSTFTIWDCSTSPFRQAAVFQNNEISPMLFPDVIVKWAKVYNDAMVVIESNDEGASVARGVYYDHEYENTFCESFLKSTGVGILVTKKVKHFGCSRLKDMIEGKSLTLCDANSIQEIQCFVRDKNTFNASPGNHDDLVQNMWLLAYVVGSEMFQEQTGGFDLKKKLFAEQTRAIEESVPFVGLLGHADSSSAGMEYLIERGYIRSSEDLEALE